MEKEKHGKDVKIRGFRKTDEEARLLDVSHEALPSKKNISPFVCHV
jgi:hypothetical protein